MYQPGHGRFADPDPAASLGELAAAVPATLVTLSGGRLTATILPLLFDPADGPLGTLRGHLARANPQWRDGFSGVEALAIFDGPDAYVSPRLYAATRRSARRQAVRARSRVAPSNELPGMAHPLKRPSLFFSKSSTTDVSRSTMEAEVSWNPSFKYRCRSSGAVASSPITMISSF